MLERPPQRYGQSFIRGSIRGTGVGLCFCTSLLAARCPARVALAPALAPARGMIGRVLYAAAFFLF